MDCYCQLLLINVVVYKRKPCVLRVKVVILYIVDQTLLT